MNFLIRQGMINFVPVLALAQFNTRGINYEEE